MEQEELLRKASEFRQADKMVKKEVPPEKPPTSK
jgi:hypothetical protein